VTESGFQRVAAIDELVEGEGKVVVFGGEDVALFRIGEQVFAVENTCPHQGASLAEGWLEGENVSCPWHAWCFSLKTGQMTMGEYASINVYDVEIKDGNVSIAGPKLQPS
jgi:nitrite reductase (NADH) small subunit